MGFDEAFGMACHDVPPRVDRSPVLNSSTPSGVPLNLGARPESTGDRLRRGPGVAGAGGGMVEPEVGCMGEVGQGLEPQRMGRGAGGLAVAGADEPGELRGNGPRAPARTRPRRSGAGGRRAHAPSNWIARAAASSRSRACRRRGARGSEVTAKRMRRISTGPTRGIAVLQPSPLKPSQLSPIATPGSRSNPAAPGWGLGALRRRQTRSNG